MDVGGATARARCTFGRFVCRKGIAARAAPQHDQRLVFCFGRSSLDVPITVLSPIPDPDATTFRLPDIESLVSCADRDRVAVVEPALQEGQR